MHERATDAGKKISSDGDEVILLDASIGEALSVLVRRQDRKKPAPPDVVAALSAVRTWHSTDQITFTLHLVEPLFDRILDKLSAHRQLNFNDAFLLALQENGVFDVLVTFDESLAKVAGVNARTG